MDPPYAEPFITMMKRLRNIEPLTAEQIEQIESLNEADKIEMIVTMNDVIRLFVHVFN